MSQWLTTGYAPDWFFLLAILVFIFVFLVMPRLWLKASIKERERLVKEAEMRAGGRCPACGRK
jgi:hypothetical protein